MCDQRNPTNAAVQRRSAHLGERERIGDAVLATVPGQSRGLRDLQHGRVDIRRDDARGMIGVGVGPIPGAGGDLHDPPPGQASAEGCPQRGEILLALRLRGTRSYSRARRS